MGGSLARTKGIDDERAGITQVVPDRASLDHVMNTTPIMMIGICKFSPKNEGGEEVNSVRWSELAAWGPRKMSNCGARLVAERAARGSELGSMRG